MAVDLAVLEALPRWVQGVGLEVLGVEPLPGDVSLRRYFRLRLARGSAIAAHYPPEIAATCGRFRRTSELLAAAGVRVPRLLAHDCDHGWMLVEDLGPRTRDDHADAPWPQLEAALGAAVELVPRIAALERETVATLSPPLDREVLRRELRQTWELLLAPLGIERDVGLA